MLTAQQSPHPTLSPYANNNNNTPSNPAREAPVVVDKRQVPAKSLRRRAESVSSPNRNGTEFHHTHSQKDKDREEYRAPTHSTSFMHWTKIRTVGKNKPKARRGHTMTLVGEKIFIFGGSDSEVCFNDLYIFDAETYWWSVQKTKGMVPPPKPCRALTANLIGDYIFYFAGGDGPVYYNSLYLLNTKTLLWEKPEVRGQIPNPRRAHSSWVFNDLLYIFAGGDGMAALNDIYVLKRDDGNPNTSINNSPAGKSKVNGYQDMNSISNSIDNYSDSNSFSENKDNVYEGGNISQRNIQHSNSGNYRNHVRNNNRDDDDDIPPNPNLRFVWTKLTTTGEAPSPRGYHTSTLIGNKVVVYGGSDGHKCFSEVYILDLERNHWSRIVSNKSIPRLSHTATQVGSYLFIIGGHDVNHYSHSILLLNLVTLRWELRRVYGERPSNRGYHSAVLFDSRIFLFGGYDGHKIFDDMYVLDLSASAYLPQITEFEIGGILD